MDENQYAIDISMVPRGGNRRRKSMEPRALTALDGNNLNSIPQSKAVQLQTPPDTDICDTEQPLEHTYNDYEPLQTPVRQLGGYADLDFDMSPTTPYFLKPEQLVQRTCPPKQAKQPIVFPLHSKLAVEKEESVRQRLMLARRKTMQFAPKIGSPLIRATSSNFE